MKKYIPLLICIIAIITAIILRIILPWGTIFQENITIFQGVDAYYYLHLADIISSNNMQIPQFDAYYDFPNGLDYSQLPSTFNAYGWFIALLTWIFTWGQPTKSALDFIAALHPAILGILALIPIFFITRTICKNNYVASGAMLLGSIIPGEYMGRAMLGATDTHCLEIFLFSYIMMFTIFSLNDSRLKFLWIGLTSIFYASYLLIWQGAVIYGLFMSILGIMWLIWGKIQGKQNFSVATTICVILALSTMLYLLVAGINVNYMYMLFVPILGLAIIFMYTVFTQKLKLWIYLSPLIIISLALIGAIISLKFVGYNFYPQWFNGAINQVYNLVAWHTQSTTSEELPLLVTLGTVSIDIPWIYFGLPWYLTFVGIGMLTYQWLKKNSMNIFFLLLWTLFMLLPELAMRRFAYYFAINVIIVSAWAIWMLLKYFWGKSSAK